jgi:hypothetical protein
MKGSEMKEKEDRDRDQYLFGDPKAEAEKIKAIREEATKPRPRKAVTK